MAGTKGKSGGSRAGAGRPRNKKTQSEKAKKAWVKAAKDFAKKHGVTVETAILEMIMDTDVQDTAKIAAAKLYCDALIIKTTESNVNVAKTEKPGVYVPQRRDDPALKVVAGGR